MRWFLSVKRLLFWVVYKGWKEKQSRREWEKIWACFNHNTSVCLLIANSTFPLQSPDLLELDSAFKGRHICTRTFWNTYFNWFPALINLAMIRVVVFLLTSVGLTRERETKDKKQRGREGNKHRGASRSPPDLQMRKRLCLFTFSCSYFSPLHGCGADVSSQLWL